MKSIALFGISGGRVSIAGVPGETVTIEYARKEFRLASDTGEILAQGKSLGEADEATTSCVNENPAFARDGEIVELVITEDGFEAGDQCWAMPLGRKRPHGVAFTRAGFVVQMETETASTVPTIAYFRLDTPADERCVPPPRSDRWATVWKVQ